jgi:hypothetical protein
MLWLKCTKEMCAWMFCLQGLADWLLPYFWVPASTPCFTKLGPNWSQLARVRPKLCLSWAQIGLCLAQFKAKDGQIWPQSCSVLRPASRSTILLNFEKSPLNCTISISMWVQAVLAAKRPELHHMIFRKHNLSGKKLATMVLVAFQTLLRCIIPFSLTCRHCHSTGDVWSKLAQIQTVMPFSLCRFDPMPTNSGDL